MREHCAVEKAQRCRRDDYSLRGFVASASDVGEGREGSGGRWRMGRVVGFRPSPFSRRLRDNDNNKRANSRQQGSSVDEDD